MQREILLRRVAIGCAIFMLFGPVADRTTWVNKRGGTIATDAAGYNMAALVSGAVALAALGFAFWARPRVVLPVLGVAFAIAAFGLTVVVSGLYGLVRLRGEVLFYGASEVIADGPRVNPAIGPPFFATAALIGAVSTVALGVGWLLQPKGAEQ
jgi:hypothetical protein